jgi:chemotaxis protein methyltransferase CheR
MTEETAPPEERTPEREIEEIEIDLLLEAIFLRYGYDFRDYARASVQRKVLAIAKNLGVTRVSELIPRLLHDQTLFATIVGAFSTPVTEMFRDPPFFKFLRETIVPYLQTYPFVRIWLAGCATGEEAYSLAILLKEEGLYERSTLFATDFVDDSLRRAREGIYPLRAMKTNIMNYQQAGGHHLFSDYYHADYGSAIMDAGLRENITFANHNLVTDGVFSETHLILCRNVLIYFNPVLQRRVLGLFHQSLLHGGFLALGSKESMRHHEFNNKFQEMEPTWKVYRKID